MKGEDMEKSDEERLMKLEKIANKIVSKINREIFSTEIYTNVFYRRNLDGVSGERLMLEKMVSELLLDGKINSEGLICWTEDPTE